MELAEAPAAVWHYVGIPAHFPGTAALLKHHIRHYIEVLGFPRSTFLCSVNFNSTQEQAVREYLDIRAVLREHNLSCVEWQQEYDTYEHQKVRQRLFAQKGLALRDWMVVSDLDEFHTYPLLPVHRFLEQLDRDGYNYVAGHFVDRVALAGKLPDIDPSRPLEGQFPLQCNLTSALSKRATVAKVVASKGYLRSGPGNHNIYKDGRQLRELGLLQVTPYGWFPECYSKRRTKSSSSPCGDKAFEFKRFPEVLPVHHFKWHSGVAASAQRRLRHYRGDDIGQTRFKWWSQSDRLLKHLAANNMTINLSKVKCRS